MSCIFKTYMMLSWKGVNGLHLYTTESPYGAITIIVQHKLTCLCNTPFFIIQKIETEVSKINPLQPFLPNKQMLSWNYFHPHFQYHIIAIIYMLKKTQWLIFLVLLYTDYNSQINYSYDFDQLTTYLYIQYIHSLRWVYFRFAKIKTIPPNV